MANLEEYRSMTHYELMEHPIISIYDEVLQGIRKTMPRGTWEDGKNIILIFRYALELKMKLRRDQIPKINKRTIKQLKLWGALNQIRSIKRIIHLVYPNQYNEFDFERVPKNYWSNEGNLKNRIEYYLQTENLTVEDIPEVITYEKLLSWGLANPLKRYGYSPFKLINNLYPEKFRENEFRSLPQGYARNKDYIKVQFEDMVKKENIKFEDIPHKITQQLLLTYKFSGTLKYFNGSPSKLINFIYPGCFKIDSFHRTNYFWNNKENVKSTIENLIKEANLSIQHIPKFITKKLLQQKGLGGLLDQYHGSPIEIVMDIYPDQFDVTEFQRGPNRYWYDRENRINALKAFCKKREIHRNEMPDLTRAYFKIHFPRFISMVDRHYDSKFHLWIMDSFPEHKFTPAEFNLHMGSDQQLCDSKEELFIHNYLVSHLREESIIKREGNHFFNSTYQERYFPDWILYQGDMKYIIEYFGLYESNKYRSYTEKVHRKMEFYLKLEGYSFIPIFPHQVRNQTSFELIKELLREKGLNMKH